MKIFYLWLFMALSSIGLANEQVKLFINSLSEEDRVVLDGFLRQMVQSINGYVIYGNKPMGLTGYLNTVPYLPYGYKAQNSFFPKGKKLWERLNISPHNKEYLFAIFNSNGYCNFIAINRKALLEVINQNLSLFQYALGPSVTPEKFLENLIDAKDDFYQVYKDDNALFGIMLGYGTKNALLVSRAEFLGYSCRADQQEEFPLLPYLTRVHMSGVPKNQTRKPSFGFRTIIEEIEALQSKMDCSHNDPPLKPYALPFFGCDIATEETQKLLSTYKKNQQEVLAVVNDPDFLEKTLTKFLTTTTGEIEIPKPLPKMDEVFDASEEDLSNKVAALLVLNTCYKEKRSWELCIDSFLAGMEDQEGKEENSFDEEEFTAPWSELFELKRELDRCENLREANTYFSRLAHSKKVACLIPNQIYYKTLKSGHGKPATEKICRATIQYSYRLRGDQKPAKVGTIENESPEYFIPGIVHVIVGMQRGEERWVAIHPKYGYGENSFFPPNSTLLAKIQLIDFEEGEKEISPMPTPELSMKNIEEMQIRYDEIKKRRYYSEGQKFWHDAKQANFPFNLEKIKKATAELIKDVQLPFDSFSSAFNYSLALQEYLYTKKQIAKFRR